MSEPGADGETAIREAAESTRALPDVSAEGTVESALESLLLVVDAPVGENVLAAATGEPTARVTAALHRLAARYAGGGSGIELQHAGGGWRYYTRDEWEPFVERLLQRGVRSKLTRATLETFAVIAYRQPVPRSRVAAVPGGQRGRGRPHAPRARPDRGGGFGRCHAGHFLPHERAVPGAARARLARGAAADRAAATGGRCHR